MHAHLHRDPAAIREAEDDLARWEDDGAPVYEPRPAPHAAEWLRIAAALSGRLPQLCGREDLIVTCEHRTASGAPAAYFPATATVEVHTAIFAPHAPATLDPGRAGDEERYPAAWGAFVHEAAHAAHSRWDAPPRVRRTAAYEAAMALEESRAERAHLARRPEDRRYLRACVKTLVAPDFNHDAPADRWHAAQAAALILARRDAGLFDPREAEPLADAVEQILGPGLLADLAGIWAAAHATADDDAEAMLAHGRAWCDLLGTPPTAPAPAPAPGQGPGRAGSTGAGVPGGGPGGGEGGWGEVLGEVFGRVEAGQAAEARRRARTARAARARQAEALAKQVFAPGAGPCPASPHGHSSRARTPITGTREPSGEEKAAAGALARALRGAAYRERVESVTISAVPPGRLTMRGALARDAQRAAGATPTAQPWTTTRRRHTPAPPLRAGIAVDVSGSMQAAAAPIASAAWIIAKAAALTDPDSRTAAIAYDAALSAVTRPGRAPRQVTCLRAKGGGHALAEAIDALTAALDLDRPGTGRLLAIASDGLYQPAEAERAAERIAALRAAGCAVLWLGFSPRTAALPGATYLHLDDPARAAAAIGKAATAAITTTR